MEVGVIKEGVHAEIRSELKYTGLCIIAWRIAHGWRRPELRNAFGGIFVRYRTEYCIRWYNNKYTFIISRIDGYSNSPMGSTSQARGRCAMGIHCTMHTCVHTWCTTVIHDQMTPLCRYPKRIVHARVTRLFVWTRKIGRPSHIRTTGCPLILQLTMVIRIVVTMGEK